MATLLRGNEPRPPYQRESRGKVSKATHNRAAAVSFVGETSVTISSDSDIVKARQQGRRIAAEVGFGLTDMALIATSISELARNIVRYARNGEIIIQPMTNSSRHGIRIIARDEGPGIRDPEKALEIGFSTSGGLGLGLPGVRRLMDEFEIQSKLEQGTTVSITKWRP